MTISPKRLAAAKAVVSSLARRNVGMDRWNLFLSACSDPRRWRELHIDQALVRVSSGTIGEAQGVLCQDPLTPLDCFPEAAVKLLFAARMVRRALQHDSQLSPEAGIRAYSDEVLAALNLLAERIADLPEIGLLCAPGSYRKKTDGAG